MSAEKYMFTGGNEVSYYPMGEDVFEDIFADLEKAEKFILLISLLLLREQSGINCMRYCLER